MMDRMFVTHIHVIEKGKKSKERKNILTLISKLFRGKKSKDFGFLEHK